MRFFKQLPTYLFLLVLPCIPASTAQAHAQTQTQTALDQEPVMLNPAYQRYTAPAAKADLGQLASFQTQLLAKNTNQTLSNDYVWVKAQRWLDVAQDEYRNNNRGPVPQQALGEALRLLELLGHTLTESIWETAALDGTPAIRADLQARIQNYRVAILNQLHPNHAAAACGSGSVAYAQVQLSWAAWVNASYGWRSALPYVAHAEKMLQKADTQFKECDLKPAPIAVAMVATPSPDEVKALPAVLAPPIVPAPIALASQPIALPTRAYFEHDRFKLSLDAQANLQAIAALLKLHPDVKVSVEGYADDTGSLLRNQALSKQRAKVTADYLAAQGLSAQRLQALGVGTIATQGLAKQRANPINRRAQLLIQVAADHPIRAQLLANQTAAVKTCKTDRACR